MSATTRVFANVGLLERIFLHDLSAAEVTRARRLNSFIQTTIDNSIALRRVMFLAPELTIEEIIPSYYDSIPEAELVPPWKILKAHPAIKSPSWYQSHVFNGFRIKAGLLDNDWEPGMWQSMFICQPPPPDGLLLGCIKETWWTGDMFETWHHSEMACVRIQGNTLGALVEGIESLQLVAHKDQRVRLSDLKIQVVGFMEEDLAFVLKEQKQRAAEKAAEEAEKAAEEEMMVEATKVQYQKCVENNKGIMEMLEERMIAWSAEAEAEEAALAQAAAEEAAAEEADQAMNRAADAAARVFGVTELLERVLEVLSPAKITRARQINSAFKAKIDNSLPLRRAMFLELDPSIEILRYNSDGLEMPEASDDDGFNDSSDDSDEGKPSEKLIKNFTVIKIHPALRMSHRNGDKCIDFRVPKTPWAPGMWQDMLICQPPCSSLQPLNLRARSNFRSTIINFWREHAVAGDTLGDLMKIINGLKDPTVELKFDVPKGFEVDGTRPVQLARDRALASCEADEMVARCKAKQEEEDDGPGGKESTDEMGVLFEGPGIKEKETQSSKPDVQKTKVNRFGRPMM